MEKASEFVSEAFLVLISYFTFTLHLSVIPFVFTEIVTVFPFLAFFLTVIFPFEFAVAIFLLELENSAYSTGNF